MNRKENDPNEHSNHGKKTRFIWCVERGAAYNFRQLGARLSTSGDLFRNGSDGQGLLQLMSDGSTRLISKGADLAPVIVDRVSMLVVKEGKPISELPTAGNLTAMLRSNEFLDRFVPVDQVATRPYYLENFTVAARGYHDGGRKKRTLYVGPEPTFSDSLETTYAFLDVMEFATNADRTNTVAAALTVLLRHHWLGEKPVVLVTATKSHAGKGTITEFVRGPVPKADILYEAIDWPMQVQFQKQLRSTPDMGLVVFDNVRLDSAGGRAGFIRSAFVESFVTNAQMTLASPGAGEAMKLDNKYVVTINTNDGVLSVDLMNRSLSICLAPTGDIHDRKSPIGNPKLEFLPHNQEQIESELRGMIERLAVRWTAARRAGPPSDVSLAQTIGGILKHAGFKDFLGNYQTCKAVADPIAVGLSTLGAACPGKALRPREWAKLVVDHGLTKTLLSPNERDTPKSRERAIGVVLSKHLNENFAATTETKRLKLRLDGGIRRWISGKSGHSRYVFEILDEQPREVEE